MNIFASGPQRQEIPSTHHMKYSQLWPWPVGVGVTHLLTGGARPAVLGDVIPNGELILLGVLSFLPAIPNPS